MRLTMRQETMTLTCRLTCTRVMELLQKETLPSLRLEIMWGYAVPERLNGATRQTGPLKFLLSTMLCLVSSQLCVKNGFSSSLLCMVKRWMRLKSICVVFNLFSNNNIYTELLIWFDVTHYTLVVINHYVTLSAISPIYQLYLSALCLPS